MVYFAKWKIAAVLLVCLLGLAFALPNVLSQQQAESLPTWLPHKQVSLGLDLQGGSHLLLEVETSIVVQEQLEALVSSVRDELRAPDIGYRELGVAGDGVSVIIIDANRIDEARALLREIDPDATVEQDGDRLSVVLSEQAVRERQAAAVDQSIEIIRRRIDETGVREPTIQRQGVDRILVQLPGVDDPERIKELIGQTAKMDFHLVDEEASASQSPTQRVPPTSMRLPSSDDLDPSGRPRMLVVRKRVVVSGENLVDAQPTFDARTNEPIVNFRFDTIGGKRFGSATSNNVGQRLAIVLDGEIISAPRINEPILGGSGQISGRFTVAEAQDLALLLRAGALPADITYLEERTVGPGLGADSIAAGKLASIVGLIAVAVFMVVAYGFFGLVANLSLFVNMVLIFGALSVLQATLTLPGIAGIVLTIGMAVDANVLIFEHIREEVRAGRTPISAIDAGFSRALTTIVDANLTTLIAAILLYSFGSGPIRGFAVTLAIGIAASMFTAIMLTRLVIVTWLRRRKPQALPI